VKTAREFYDSVVDCEGDIQGTALIEARDREVRAATLREVAEKFPSHEPPGEDNDAICAECFAMVIVDRDCEWSDGDVCDKCAGTAFSVVEGFVNHQIALLAERAERGE